MPNEIQNVDSQVEKNVEIFGHNQCNIDIRCLSLHHSFSHEYANSQWHKNQKGPQIQIKRPKQKLKITVTETTSCNFKDFFEKITLHLNRTTCTRMSQVWKD